MLRVGQPTRFSAIGPHEVELILLLVAWRVAVRREHEKARIPSPLGRRTVYSIQATVGARRPRPGPREELGIEKCRRPMSGILR